MCGPTSSTTDGLPDPGRWSYDTMSNESGWANKERQYHADARRENSRVENGVLVIEARHEPTRAFKDSGGQEVHIGTARHERPPELDVWLFRDPREATMRSRHPARDLDAGRRAGDQLAGHR